MGWVSSLVSSLGAPLAAGLVNRFLVMPYQEEMERQKQIENPMALRQREIDLTKSLMGQYGAPQTPEEGYRNFPLMTSLAAGMGPEKFAPFVGQYGAGYGHVASAQPLAQEITSMTPAKVGLARGQEYHQRAEGAATEALTPARIQETLASALAKNAQAGLTQEQTKETAALMGSKVDLQKSMADLHKAQAEGYRTGDRSAVATAALNLMGHIYPQLQMSIMAGNKNLTPEQTHKMTSEAAANVVADIIRRTQAVRMPGPQMQPQQPTIQGGRPPWLDARPPR